MPNYLKTIFEICFFRARPQDLPASGSLALLCAVAAVIAYTISNTGATAAGSALLISVVQVGLFGVFASIALRLRKAPERWLQTITALYGAGALLQLIGWPVTRWYDRVQSIPDQAGLPFLMIVFIGFWYLAIMTAVLKQSMDLTLSQSLLLSFVGQAVVVIMMMSLFGGLSPGL